MIILVNFLLLVEDVINYSKENVDKGETPHNVYKLCSCIREAFCLSYTIRKDNNLYIYYQTEYLLIKLKGDKLRYLGPDERSQALLLQKVLFNTKQYTPNEKKKWIKSTPGFFFIKFPDDNSFFSFYISIVKGKSYLTIHNNKNIKENLISINLKDEPLDLMEDNFYTIPTYSISKKNSKIIKLFLELKNIKILLLPQIKSVENKILYLNFKKDKEELLKNKK